MSPLTSGGVGGKVAVQYLKTEAAHEYAKSNSFLPRLVRSTLHLAILRFRVSWLANAIFSHVPGKLPPLNLQLHSGHRRNVD